MSDEVHHMEQRFSHGYALLIGVGESAYPKWSLPAAVKDIQALRSVLADPHLCAYPDDEHHIRLLHDAGATHQAILDGLAWLQERAQSDPEATIVVYYSGHGWLDASAGRYYLIPHDIEPFDLAASALPAETFTATLRQIPARRLLVFVDSCHAAGMATSKDAPAVKLPAGFVPIALPKSLVDDLKQGQGRAVFTSSSGEQSSWVHPDGTMSIYTYHLLEAFQGAGNQPGDTVVRLSNLMHHLGKAVPESVRRAYQAEQVPFFDTATEDFPVALLRGGKGLPAGGWEAVRREAEATIRQITCVQAIGERSVAIGGDVTDSTIVTGDRNVVQRGKYNIQMDRAQGVTIGDQAQVTQTFVEGGVHGGTVVTAGRDARVTPGATPEQIRALFEPILRQVQARPEDPIVDRGEIAEHVGKIRDEVAKGEQANSGKVERWLRFLAEMAPDIWDVVVKTLADPVTGIAEVVRKVAKRAREERAGQTGLTTA